MSLRSTSYAGKVAVIGNSKGFRIDAALFHSHPEFSGSVKVQVVSPGHLLLSIENNESEKEAYDPILLSFLDYIEQDMQQHPEDIKPVTKKQLTKIKKLIKGVDQE